MGGRASVFMAFILLGFLAGIVAYVTYQRVVPVLLLIFPEFLNAEWFLSGMAGALLTTVVLVIWASVSPPK